MGGNISKGYAAAGAAPIRATRQMPMISHRGAIVNVPGYQIATLHGSNIGRGGAGSAKRTTNYATGNKCPALCKVVPCNPPCDTMYFYN